MLTLFSILLTLWLVSYTFRYTHTIYIMLYSVLVFIGAFMLLISVEFEFFAIAILTVYVGGIAVMFLFLIITIDLREEAAKTGTLKDDETFFFPQFLLMLIIVTILYFYIIVNYNPYLFEIDLFYLENMNFTIDYHVLSGESTVSQFFGDEWSLIEAYYFLEFNDIIILGWYLYRYFGPYVAVVGLYLLIATIVAVMFCINSVVHYNKQKHVFIK